MINLAIYDEFVSVKILIVKLSYFFQVVLLFKLDVNLPKNISPRVSV